LAFKSRLEHQRFKSPPGMMSFETCPAGAETLSVQNSRNGPGWPRRASSSARTWLRLCNVVSVSPGHFKGVSKGQDWVTGRWTVRRNRRAPSRRWAGLDGSGSSSTKSQPARKRRIVNQMPCGGGRLARLGRFNFRFARHPPKAAHLHRHISEMATTGQRGSLPCTRPPFPVGSPPHVFVQKGEHVALPDVYT